MFATFAPLRGPTIERADKVLDRDYLRAFGLDEASLSQQQITDLAESTLEGGRLVRDIHHVAGAFRACVVRSGAEYVDLHRALDRPEPTVAYCACEVASRVNRTVALLASSNDGMKCWVNRGLVVSLPASSGTDKKKAIKYYERLALVHLRAGRNLVVVKVNQKSADWGFVAKLTSLPRAHILESQYSMAPLLDTRLLKVGDPLRVSYPLCDPTCPVTLGVRDIRGRCVVSQRFDLGGKRAVPLGGLPAGIYSARLTTPYGVSEETFYVGDLEAEMASVRERIARQHETDRVRMHTDAWLYRVRHICRPENKHVDDLGWQDRMLNVLANIEAVLADPAGGDSLLRSPGYRIRAYRSSIDGQPHYYTLIVPHDLKAGRPMPLMFMAPGTFHPARPFLEGRIVASSKDVAKYTAMAEERGCIVAQPCAGGNAAGKDMRERDLLDALADIERDYPVDRNRIYGFGACTGGTQILSLAAHHPSLFAAVAAYAPLVGNGTGGGGFASSTDPAEIISNLIHVPLLIMHSSGDTEVPVQSSVDFVRLCKQHGVAATLDLIDGGSHRVETADVDEVWWAFTKGKRRVARPRAVTVCTWHLRYGRAYWARISGIGDRSRLATLHATIDGASRIIVHTANVTDYELLPQPMPAGVRHVVRVVTNGRVERIRLGVSRRDVHVRAARASRGAAAWERAIDGPIADAFAGPFLVVEGTGGTAAQRASASGAARALCAAWRSDFHVPCRCKRDVDVPPGDIARYNLLLFGVGNGIYARVAGSLPIRLTRDSVSLAGRVYRGRDLFVEALLPNPLARHRCVVLVGSSSAGQWRMPSPRLWMDGTYDYFVVDPQGSEGVGLYSGGPGPGGRRMRE